MNEIPTELQWLVLCERVKSCDDEAALHVFTVDPQGDILWISRIWRRNKLKIISELNGTKGAIVREIVKEVADARDDFTILSHDDELAKRQILEVLSKTHQLPKL